MDHNYHTHTYLCGHSSGVPSEYIEKALERNLKFLGFSDHAPYIFPGSFYSNFRMYPEDTKTYYRMLGELREEYKEKAARQECAPIEIRIGFEMEYYPDCFERTLDFMHESAVTLSNGKEAGLDYLILGQHFSFNEYDGTYSGGFGTEERHLKSYTENVIHGMESGAFTYVAHPDVARYTGPDKIYESYVRELCQTAKALNIPLEINLLGLHEGRYYPNERFWEIAADCGVDAILGCDAHHVPNVANPDILKEGEDYAKKFGLNLLTEVELRQP